MTTFRMFGAGAAVEPVQAEGDPHVQLLYVDGDRMGCRDATREEALSLSRKSPDLELRELRRPGGSTSALQATGLRIVLRGTPQLDAYPQAKDVFLQAAAVWEGLIRNPITVILDVDYGPTRFGEAWPSSSVLGSTSSQVLGSPTYYSVLRNAIQARNTSLPQLPTDSLPTDIGATERVYSPSPILRSLGLISATADPANEPNFGAPPSIGFNSNFAFDVTPANGVDPDKYDFLSVAVHEIGHALGFTSYAGHRELYPDAPLTASAWDIFRFRSSVSSTTFPSMPRTLTSGGEQAFFAGGAFLSLSTGRPDATGGDKRQASHWKDDDLSGYYIGIMDPTISRGVRKTVTTADRLGLKAMGYDVTASMPTISNAMTTKAVPENVCTPLPTPTSVFSASDARVYLFFYIAGHAEGEVLTRVWYSPDGREFARGSWSALSAASSYCMPASLSIAGTTAATQPGTWRVRVFSNVMPDVPYVDLSFQLLASSAPAPTINNAMTSKTVPEPLCASIPAAVSDFTSADSNVHLYFRTSGFQESEAFSVRWIDPTGAVYRRASWSPLSTQYTYYCMSDLIVLSGTAAAQKTGTWRIQVSVDRLSDVTLLERTFTVAPAATDLSAGTWLLTSSARVQGAGAFWRTDLTIRNAGAGPATVQVKFLGHSGDGRGGPERTVTLSPWALSSWKDVLWSLFGLESEYGPILIRSSSPQLAILGETFTPGGGGTYGQAVPALAIDSLVGGTPRTILGVRQNAGYRTNLMLASATPVATDVDVALISATGTNLAVKRVRLGPMSRAQFNVANDFGVSNLDGGAFVISSPTPGALVGAYASVIDSVTADPRTLLPQ